MATRGGGLHTFPDIVAGLKADGHRDMDVVDLTVKETPFLDDLHVQEANDGTGNKSVIETGLPAVSWPMIYEGTAPSKGERKEVRDASGYASSLMELAARLYDIAPDKAAYLLQNAKSHLRAMGNAMGKASIYGNIKTDPNQFNGLALRYPQHGGTDVQTAGYYCINGARAAGSNVPSTAAMRSIYLVGHGSDGVYGFYPKGTTAGLKPGTPDMDAWSFDVNKNRYKSIIQLFEWNMGITVKDFRKCGRLSNIESDAMFGDTGMPNYIELLRRLKTRVESDGVRQCWYMGKSVLEMLEVRLSRLTQANAVTQADVEGRKVTTLWGIPVRIMSCMDDVNEDQTTVVA